MRPIATDTHNFESLRKDGNIYFGKTLFMHCLVTDSNTKHFFASRPRCFKIVRLSTPEWRTGRQNATFAKTYTDAVSHFSSQVVDSILRWGIRNRMVVRTWLRNTKQKSAYSSLRSTSPLAVKASGWVTFCMTPGGKQYSQTGYVKPDADGFVTIKSGPIVVVVYKTQVWHVRMPGNND